MTSRHLFVAERTGMMRRTLRRFTLSEKPCPGNSNWGHDASVGIETVPEKDALRHSDGTLLTGDCREDWAHDDTRWLTACAACGYVFTDDDEWQYCLDALYGGGEHEPFGISDAPPGAMIRAPWLDALGKDEAWTVILPDGHQWIANKQASSGGYWQVTGTPPAITVSPSIWADAPRGWHGFVRAGTFVDA